MAYEIASALFHEVLKRQRRCGEIGTPKLDQSYRRFDLIAQQPITREATAADRPIGVSREAWDALRINRRNER